METLKIPATTSTPTIHFDPLSGLLEISGRSLPEDAFTFYEEIFKWLENYIELPLSETILIIKMDLISSSSLKCLHKISSQLKEVESKGKAAKIHWVFDEDDKESRELGESFRGVVDLPFDIIPAGKTKPGAKSSQKKTVS
jgi:hypothetical protein